MTAPQCWLCACSWSVARGGGAESAGDVAPRYTRASRGPTQACLPVTAALEHMQRGVPSLGTVRPNPVIAQGTTLRPQWNEAWAGRKPEVAGDMDGLPGFPVQFSLQETKLSPLPAPKTLNNVGTDGLRTRPRTGSAKPPAGFGSLPAGTTAD